MAVSISSAARSTDVSLTATTSGTTRHGARGGAAGTEAAESSGGAGGQPEAPQQPLEQPPVALDLERAGADGFARVGDVRCQRGERREVAADRHVRADRRRAVAHVGALAVSAQPEPLAVHVEVNYRGDAGAA